MLTDDVFNLSIDFPMIRRLCQENIGVEIKRIPPSNRLAEIFDTLELHKKVELEMGIGWDIFHYTRNNKICVIINAEDLSQRILVFKILPRHVFRYDYRGGIR